MKSFDQPSKIQQVLYFVLAQKLSFVLKRSLLARVHQLDLSAATLFHIPASRDCSEETIE